MSSFENTRQKMRKIFRENFINFDNVRIKLKPIFIKNNPTQFNKLTIKNELIRDRRIDFNIPLDGKVDSTAGENYASFIIDIPSDFVAFTELVPILKFGNAFNIDTDPNMFFDFKYWWSKITDIQYQLQVFMNVSVIQTIPGNPPVFHSIPIFWDLLLYIKNPRIIREYQTPKD